MKKVAIVGVEGSGKTVLMAAMGDKYKSPDANGLFLRPENRTTFTYYTHEAANLRAGQWPLATESQVHNLNWSLMRQKKSSPQPKTLGRLSFLDFGGEIYRRAFGDRAKGTLADEDRERKKAVKLLKAHVRKSDILIVLVNLSDIINGESRDERTIEMNWLSQAILSFAFGKGGRREVALVLTQADAYAETIASCGGARGTLQRYLREVDSAYGGRLALFTVAAVNKTVPSRDGSGLPVPADGFEPEGLEPLLDWIARGIVRQRRRRGCLLSALAAALLLGGAAAYAVYRSNAGAEDGGRRAGGTERQWLEKCGACNGKGKRERQCPNCNGQGKRPCANPDSGFVRNPMHMSYGTYGKHMVLCGNCRGHGCVSCGWIGYWPKIPCPECDGTGMAACDLCGGSGVVSGDCESCGGDGWIP